MVYEFSLAIELIGFISFLSVLFQVRAFGITGRRVPHAVDHIHLIEQDLVLRVNALII